MDSAIVNHEVIVFIEIVKNQSHNEQNPKEDGQLPDTMDEDGQDNHSKEDSPRHPYKFLALFDPCFHSTLTIRELRL